MTRPIGYGGRDYPDFGISSISTPRRYMKDMGELAVRLGSGNYFSRTGVQIYSEDFNRGLSHWRISTFGAASYVRLNAQYVDLGYYAVEIQGDTGDTDEALLRMELPYPYVSTVGFEVHVKHITAGKRVYAGLGAWYDGTYRSGGIRVNSDAETFTIWTEDSETADYDLSPYRTGGVSNFHVWKITYDFINNIFLTLEIDKQAWDISDIDLYTFDIGLGERLLFQIGAFGDGAPADQIAVDNVIITVDEPR